MKIAVDIDEYDVTEGIKRHPILSSIETKVIKEWMRVKEESEKYLALQGKE